MDQHVDESLKKEKSQLLDLDTNEAHTLILKIIVQDFQGGFVFFVISNRETIVETLRVLKVFFRFGGYSLHEPSERCT